MNALQAPLLDAPPLMRYGLPIYDRPTVPAAGANFTQLIEGRYFVRFVSVFVRLVTDANVANRTMRIEYLDAGGNVFDVSGNPVTYPANSTEDFSFNVYQGQGEWEVAATNLVPLHPMLLLPGQSLRILVNNIQAGDQLSRIATVKEQFFTTGQPPGWVPY